MSLDFKKDGIFAVSLTRLRPKINVGKISLSGAVWREMLPLDSLRVSQKGEFLSPLPTCELAIIMLSTTRACWQDSMRQCVQNGGRWPGPRLARGCCGLVSTVCSDQELCQDLTFVKSQTVQLFFKPDLIISLSQVSKLREVEHRAGAKRTHTSPRAGTWYS